MFQFSLLIVFCANVLVHANPMPHQCPCQNRGNQNFRPQPPPQYYPQQSQVLPVQNDVGQMLVQKFLSNPALKDLLSQNIGQNIGHCVGQNPGQTPGVVNNYFILPKEIFNKDKKPRKECAKKCNEDRVKNEPINEVSCRVVETEKPLCGNRNNNEAKCKIDSQDIRRLCEKLPVKERTNQKVPAENRVLLKVPRRGSIANNYPFEDTVINDIRPNFPHMSDYALKRMINNMQSQVMRQFVTEFANKYKQPIHYHLMPRETVVKLKKNKPKTENVIASNTTSLNSTATNTTENIQKEDSKPIIVKGSIANTANGHHSLTLPELGDEDDIPIYDNDIVEYYPDFTRDNRAYSLEDDYPKPYIEERIQTRHRRPFRYYTRQRITKSMPEKETEPVIEEIVYKTPPKLEIPGFTTKQVNQHDSFQRQRQIDVSEEADINFIPKEDTLKPRKKNNEDVETVYAVSKVASYGKRYAYETTTKNIIGNDFDEADKDIDATVVVAKAYDQEDYSW